MHAYNCAIEYGISNTVLENFSRCINTGFIEGPEQSAAIVFRNYLLNGTGNDIASRVRESRVAQAALYDFANQRPRRVKYTNVSGKFFDMNVARGNKLYTSFLGDE